MQARWITAVGGLLSAVFVYLPFAKLGPVTISINEIRGNNITTVMLVTAAIILIVGLVNKRWLYLLSLLAASFIVLCAYFWIGDVTKKSGGDFQGSLSTGAYLMILGGALGLIGSVMGLFKKKASA